MEKQTTSQEFQSLLLEILKLSLETADLKTFFDRVLEDVMEKDILSVEKKGGIMLYQEGELRLISYVNVPASLVKMCSRVPPGRCLCGKAAMTSQPIFKSRIDEEHENIPEGTEPHGHYNVPIVYNEQTLGVLFLYVAEGTEQDENILLFLQQLASVLALVIMRFQYENEYQYSIVKLIRTNELMIENVKKINYLEELVNTYVPQIILKNIEKTRIKKNYFDLQENYFLLFNINGILPFSEIFPIQKVYETMEEYYSPLIDIILSHGGEIEQFIEDKILAIFDDSYSAASVALKMLDTFLKINEKRAQLFLKPFTCQIAINFGTTFFGIIGSTKRKQWIRYGQTIRWLNLLQRKCQHNHILTSEEIYQEQKENFQFSKPFKIQKNHEQYIIARYLLK